jgi:Nucleoside 2-deoxyribosyltransferase
MKLYLAGPLFTTPERDWNTALADRLVAAGHEVFVPQASQLPDPTAEQIFARDMEGLDWSDAVVAIMDGSEPDSGTAWECGYAYARRKPIVTVRSDFRRPGEFRGVSFNLMLWCSANAHVELPLGTADEAATAIAEALDGLDPLATIGR